MSEMQVREYQTVERRIPYRDWLKSLKDKKSQAIIERRIARFMLGNFGDHRGIGDRISECRIHHGPGFRVYYLMDGAHIVILLCGGDKGSQQRDIEKAKEYGLDYWRSK